MGNKSSSGVEPAGSGGEDQQTQQPANEGSIGDRFRSFFSGYEEVPDSKESKSNNAQSQTWKPMPLAGEGASCCGLTCDDLTLTREQRFWGFLAFFIFGTIFSILSTSFVPFILIAPRRFAFTYTLGNVMSLGSTGFLIGPVTQIKQMFAPVRFGASLAYLVSMALTLYFAIGLQMVLPTLLMVVVQMSAFLWYCLSYVPYGRDFLLSIIKQVFSGCFRC